MTDKNTHSVRALFQVQVQVTADHKAINELRDDFALAHFSEHPEHPLRPWVGVVPLDAPDGAIITDLYLPVVEKIMQGELPDFAYPGTTLVLERVQHELIPPTKEPEPGTQVLVLDKRST